MMCVVDFVLPFSQLQSVKWRWPGGGNPTMNTPRLRRGGGDSFSFTFSVTCIGSPIHYILFVT